MFKIGDEVIANADWDNLTKGKKYRIRKAEFIKFETDPKLHSRGFDEYNIPHRDFYFIYVVNNRGRLFGYYDFKFEDAVDWSASMDEIMAL